MKKLLLVLLAMLLMMSMVFSLAACGDEEDDIVEKDPNSEVGGDPTPDHVHSLTKVDATSATCDAAGNSEYYSCTCGKYFGDAAATAEIAQNSWVIPAAHTYAQEWSCDANGHWKAATCSHNSEKGESAAHTMENGACTVCSYSTGAEVDADAWKNAFSSIKNVTLEDFDYDSYGNLTYKTVYKYDLYADSHFGQVQSYTYEATDGTLADDWYAASYHHYFVDGVGNMDADSYFHQSLTNDGFAIETVNITYNSWKSRHDTLYDYLTFFKNYYSRFTYNSERGVYELNSYIPWESNDNYNVKVAEARFDSLGNLVSFEYEYNYKTNPHDKFVMKDVGTTEIVGIEDGPVVPLTAEQEAFVNAITKDYTNVTVTMNDSNTSLGTFDKSVYKLTDNKYYSNVWLDTMGKNNGPGRRAKYEYYTVNSNGETLRYVKYDGEKSWSSDGYKSESTEDLVAGANKEFYKDKVAKFKAFVYDFTYDSATKTYAAESIRVGNVTYTNITVVLDDNGDLKSFSYSTGAYYYELVMSDIGSTVITEY